MYIPKDQKWSLKVDKGQKAKLLHVDFSKIESSYQVHKDWADYMLTQWKPLKGLEDVRDQNTVYFNHRSEEVLFYTDEGKIYQVDTLSGRSHLIDKLIRGQNMGVASSGSMYTDIQANIFDEDRSAPVTGFGYLQIHGEHVYRMMFTFKSAIGEGCQVDVRVFTRLPNQSQDWFKIQVMFAARRKVHGTDA